MSDDDGWKMLLKTGFGNIFDIGYGWSYAGQCLIADAYNGGNDERKWKLVEDYARRKISVRPPA